MRDPSSGGPPPRPPGAYAPGFWRICAVTGTVLLGAQLLTASLPLYAVRLGASDAMLGAIAGVVAVASLVSRPWIGVWIDAGGAAAAPAGRHRVLRDRGARVLGPGPRWPGWWCSARSPVWRSRSSTRRDRC